VGGFALLRMTNEGGGIWRVGMTRSAGEMMMG
jgi:hypothetical protein